MWLKLLPDISQKSTMGIRNCCSISFAQICWWSVIVLKSCMRSAQKPDSACCMKDTSIYLIPVCIGASPSLCLWHSPGCRTLGSVNQRTTNIPYGSCAQGSVYLLPQHTEPTAEIKFSLIMEILAASAYLKVWSTRGRWRLLGAVLAGCPLLGFGTAD